MRVLYIEDNPLDVDLTRQAFRKSRPDLELDVARSQREALEKIKGIDVANYDLVLTDMHLGDGDGLAILSHIRSRSIPLPVVILTGQGDEEFAVAALKAGAENYIVKKAAIWIPCRGFWKRPMRLFEPARKEKHIPLKSFMWSTTRRTSI